MNAYLAKTVLPALIATVFLSGSVLAADQQPASGMSEPSKETREKMATLHERMAACLRSEKNVAECRSEMRQHCQTTMGEQGCPMMGMGMMGRGKHRGMMNPPSETKDDTKDTQ